MRFTASLAVSALAAKKLADQYNKARRVEDAAAIDSEQIIIGLAATSKYQYRR